MLLCLDSPYMMAWYQEIGWFVVKWCPPGLEGAFWKCVVYWSEAFKNKVYYYKGFKLGGIKLKRNKLSF